MMSVTEFARSVGISPQAVRKAIKAGRIKARKIGYCWVIKCSQIIDFNGGRHRHVAAVEVRRAGGR